MVARTISARRSGATPRLGLTPASCYLIGRPIIFERAHPVNRGRIFLRELAARAVVRGLGLALDAQHVGDATRLGEGRVALALGLGGDDLGLALGLDQLVALRLGLVLLDLRQDGEAVRRRSAARSASSRSSSTTE
jgi:hypothetical protein